MGRPLRARSSHPGHSAAHPLNQQGQCSVSQDQEKTHVLVTGVTGRVGGATAEHLLAHGKGSTRAARHGQFPQTAVFRPGNRPQFLALYREGSLWKSLASPEVEARAICFPGRFPAIVARRIQRSRREAHRRNEPQRSPVTVRTRAPHESRLPPPVRRGSPSQIRPCWRSRRLVGARRPIDVVPACHFATASRPTKVALASG